MGLRDIFKRSKNNSNKSQINSKTKVKGKSFTELNIILNNFINSWGSNLSLDSDYSFSIFKDGANCINIVGNEIVIDGRGHIIDGSGRNRLMYIKGYDIHLKNFIFQNGYFTSDFGIIHIDANSFVTFSNCEFRNNKSLDSGGAINNQSELTLIDCIFKNNHANFGGAIVSKKKLYGSISKLKIVNCKFEENSALQGGAILNDGETSIEKSLFSNNQSGAGGAIFNDINGTLGVDDSRFINNSLNSNTLAIKLAKRSGGVLEGGAILNKKTVTIRDSIFKSNDADMGGAIKNSDNAFADIFKCDFNENHSNVFGGALVNFGEMKLEESKFNVNFSKDDGGAINNQKAGIISILSSEFKDNNSNHNGGAIVNTGSMKISDSILFNNKSSEEGGAIYNLDKDLEIANCEFKRNSAKYDGGALINWGKLNISENSKFIENKAQSYCGGAIFNAGDLNLKDSLFCHNNAELKGGAILNENHMNLRGAIFKDNNSNKDGTNIFNSSSGSGKIIKSEFLDNGNDFNCIFNQGFLEILNSVFSNNKSNSIIYNDKDSSLNITNSRFNDNNSRLSSIYNIGTSANVIDVSFKNNSSMFDFSENIYNKSNLSLVKPIIDNKDKASILNYGQIEVKKLSIDDAKNLIKGGKIEFLDMESVEFSRDDLDVSSLNQSDDFGDDSSLDFTQLEELINSSSEKIINLESDIHLANYEREFFEGGIVLDSDDLYINGNGHIIDGKNKSRIFYITGKRIVLENITFTNGHFSNDFDLHSNGGGSIRIVKDASLSLVNCKFQNTFSEDDGGAIFNRGRLDSRNNEFNNAEAETYGGVIYNHGLVFSRDDSFNKSKSKFGALIYNDDCFSLDNPNFKEVNSIYLNKPIFNTEYIFLDNSDYAECIANYGDVKNLSDNIPNREIIDLIESYKNDNTMWEKEYVLIYYNNKEKYNKSISFAEFQKQVCDSELIELNENIIYDFEKDYEIVGSCLSIDENVNNGVSLIIEGNNHVIDARNSSSFFAINSFEKEIIFRNITFKNGFSNFNDLISYHYNNFAEGKIIFENCIFKNNHLKGDNYLIDGYNVYTILEFKNCVFINNSSNCGSLINNQGKTMIQESIFINNYSKAGSIIRNYEGSLTLKDSQLLNNYTDSVSYSVILNFSEMELNNSKFYYNKSASSGGVIRNDFAESHEESKIDILDCEFKGNFARNIGGVLVNFAKLSISRSDFYENTSNQGAAVIFNERTGNIKIFKSNFINNKPKDSARYKEPIYNEGKQRITSCNFQDN